MGTVSTWTQSAQVSSCLDYADAHGRLFTCLVQTGTQDPSSDSFALQNAFDDLFFTYQVDLAFYGHIHYYTR